MEDAVAQLRQSRLDTLSKFVDDTLDERVLRRIQAPVRQVFNRLHVS